jgi:hypothetical protein
MSLMRRWKNFRSNRALKMRVIDVESRVVDVPPALPAPAPEPPPAAPPIEHSSRPCPHEWRVIASGQRCMQCGLQEPPPPPPKPLDEMDARAAAIRRICNVAAYDSFETQLLRWRLRR